MDLATDAPVVIVRVLIELSEQPFEGSLGAPPRAGAGLCGVPRSHAPFLRFRFGTALSVCPYNPSRCSGELMEIIYSRSYERYAIPRAARVSLWKLFTRALTSAMQSLALLG